MPNKMKTLDIPVSPEVAAFAVVMEAKLQMEGYDQVESWKDIPLERLVAQMKTKVERLAATDPKNAYEVFTKAVVLGNLAMMIAEKTALAREAAETAAKEQGGTVVNFPAAEAANTPQEGKTSRTKRGNGRTLI